VLDRCEEPGIGSVEDLEENVAAAGIELSNDEIEQLERA
jgi:aryl-alcohol dehydrogenase-like predicted oxidoreductase